MRERETETNSVFATLCVCVCVLCINISLQVLKWLCGALYLEEAWLNLLSPYLCGQLSLLLSLYFCWVSHFPSSLSCSGSRHQIVCVCLSLFFPVTHTLYNVHLHLCHHSSLVFISVHSRCSVSRALKWMGCWCSWSAAFIVAACRCNTKPLQASLNIRSLIFRIF